MEAGDLWQAASAVYLGGLHGVIMESLERLWGRVILRDWVPCLPCTSPIS